MTKEEDDKRLNDILEMIGRVAALDFSQPLSISNNNDMIDAISLGLNMLSEELSTNVVEKKKLDSVNSKLEKFAFTTAHDLKSPLNSITGLVTLLEMSLPQHTQNSEAIECIVRIKRVTDQMKNLVQGILDYSRAEAAELDKDDIDLQIIVQEIVEIDQIDKQADIHFDCTLPFIRFNKSGMRQIIRNLLVNAVKYSDKERCRIIIQCKEEEDHYQISIIDNGPGIAPENHEKIFELFNKIDPASKPDSHGIGLATVKAVLQSAGERIWVTSKPGQGVTFHFTVSKNV